MFKKMIITFIAFCALLSVRAFADNASDLLRNPNDPTAGNPKGSVTLVEFFDYQCGYCIAMTNTIAAVIKSNPDLRVVFKEFPIRGQLSETLSRVALASRLQGKYFSFHEALMNNSSTLDENNIFTIAKNVGLNVDQLKKDMQSDTILQQLKNNYQLANQLDVSVTPVFFIAKTNANDMNSVKVELGSMSQRSLQSLINSVKK